MPALSDEGFQFAAKSSHVGEFPLHLRQALPGDHVHGLARPLLLVGKIEQCPDLLDGKPKIAGAPREGQTAGMSG